MLKIVDYSSSSSDENENPQIKRIKLPSAKELISESKDEVENDDEEAHEGRKRSFAHERGIWATYCYFSMPYNHESAIKSLRNEIIKYFEENNNLQGIDLKPINEPHISLTRTFILRHHWIKPFVTSLHQNLPINYRRTSWNLGSVTILTNDEKTRTFISLEITENTDYLLDLVKSLDLCLEEFKLPKFYGNPSFHVSILWCLGDQRAALKNHIDQLNEIFNKFLESDSADFIIDGNILYCKSGNKNFEINLLAK